MRLLKFLSIPDYLTFMSSLCASICDSGATSWLGSRENLLANKGQQMLFLFLLNIYYSHTDTYECSLFVCVCMFCFLSLLLPAL
jgi:hypothetical protein